MSFRGDIEDRTRIRERYDCYSDAVFRRDTDDYLDCWAADGVRTGAGGECHGTDDLRSHFESMWKLLDRMAYFHQLGAIEIDGDRATARAWCHELLLFPDEQSHEIVGRYEDELVRQDDGWRFAKRHYTVHMS